MTESWQLKKYYDKRVLIDAGRVLNSTFDPVIICLDGSEVEMLRNLTQYLHRHSTFASSYMTSRYVTPGNDDWDTIQGIVSSLERKLMGCEEIESIFGEMRDSMVANTAILDAIMQCVCAMSSYQGVIASGLPDVSGYVDQTLLNYLNPGESEGAPASPATDTEKCELAQSMFYYIFDSYTEIILPWADSSSDAIVSVIVALSAFSALSGFIGLPVAVLSAIVFAIVAWAIEGSIANFTNWLFSIKDEYVCALYSNYPDYDAASLAVRALIDSQVDISFLDKQLAKVFMGSAWHMTWVSQEQQTNSTWDARFTPGQCDACEQVPAGCWPIGPCDLSDWTGGVVVCLDGLATIQGGTGRWNVETHVPGPSSYLVVNFTPKSSGPPSASAAFGLVRQSDMLHFNVIPAVAYPVDVPVTVYAAVPSALWGVDCYLDVKQVAFWASPIYWCLQSSPP